MSNTTPQNDCEMPTKSNSKLLATQRSRSLDRGLQTMGLVDISEELNPNNQEFRQQMDSTPDNKNEKKTKKKGMLKTKSTSQLAGSKSKSVAPVRYSVPNLNKRRSTVDSIVTTALGPFHHLDEETDINGKADIARPKVTKRSRSRSRWESSPSSSLEDDQVLTTSQTCPTFDVFASNDDESAAQKRKVFINSKLDRVSFRMPSNNRNAVSPSMSTSGNEQSSCSDQYSTGEASLSSAESVSNKEQDPKEEKTSQHEQTTPPSDKLSAHRSHVVKKSEMTAEEKQIQKDLSRKIKKARNERFHRFFKNIPNDEIVLKSYLCAYVGDILLQGYLYISPNYFCFYTKILGHEKQLEIPVIDVENITREKTAMFIPNAIGVVTMKDKFVFGSLMSRDRAYRHMVTAWKRAKSLTDQPDIDTTGRRSQQSIEVSDDSSFSDCQSDDNSCISLDDITPDDTDTGSTSQQRAQFAQSHNTIPADVSPEMFDAPDTSSTAHASEQSAGFVESLNSRTSNGERPLSAPKPCEDTTRNGRWLLTDMSLVSSVSSSVHAVISSTQRMSRTRLLLVVSLIIAVMLMFSAAVMTRKIYYIQSQLDARAALDQAQGSKYLHCPQPNTDAFHMQEDSHTPPIERIHNIMKSNMELLTHVQGVLSKSSQLPAHQDCGSKNND